MIVPSKKKKKNYTLFSKLEDPQEFLVVYVEIKIVSRIFINDVHLKINIKWKENNSHGT